ncbi:MAG: transposase [Blastocatellia bacterium]|nr:transposase [Blastocatellia bacterium]
MVWCGGLNQVVTGMQAVLLIWTDGHWKVPIGLRRWRTGDPSKISFALELIQTAAQAGLTPTHVVFGSWYAAAVLLNRLDDLIWRSVAQLKSHRTVDGHSIRHRWSHRFGHTDGHLRHVPHLVRVIKDGRRFWVTNELRLTPAQIKQHYQVRQSKKPFVCANRNWIGELPGRQGPGPDRSSAHGIGGSVV